MPLIRERWQSSRLPAPNAWETRVSSPARRPSAKKAKTMKMLELMLTAPMEAALLGKRPTIMVSTITMLIQPISASTKGSARRRVGGSSSRNVDQVSIERRKSVLGECWGRQSREEWRTRLRGLTGEEKKPCRSIDTPCRRPYRQRWTIVWVCVLVVAGGYCFSRLLLRRKLWKL